VFKKKPSRKSYDSMKESTASQQSRDGVISIIGPGMKVVGDCITEGTLRIDGTVEGSVKAGKAVVIGKDSLVIGDITTQDAVIGGRVQGRIIAESRLELQSTCVVEGEVYALRIKLDEGGQVFGTLQMGEAATTQSAGKRKEAPEQVPAGN
jgi:cytoskeletal protein CcmA (bactofilin family)